MAVKSANSTTADLAEACKLMALALCQQTGAQPKPARRRSAPNKRRSAPITTPKGTPNTTGGWIPRMQVNEVTGNGYIPKGSSNFGLRGLR